MYYLMLVPYHIFLWLVQRVTKRWGEEWTDAYQQGGYFLKVRGMSIGSEWNNGHASGDVHCKWFGIFAEYEWMYTKYPKRLTFSQYVVW